MKKYRITFQHDRGTVVVPILARSRMSAVIRACAIENAPLCAVVKVERI